MTHHPRFFSLFFTSTVLFCICMPGSSLAFGGFESLIHPSTTFVSTHHHADFLQIALQQLRGLQQAYTNSLHEHPLLTKMVTGGTLAASGDAIAQRQSEEPYDKRRAASFLTFDMAYRALQHVVYPLLVAQCHGQFLSEFLPHGLVSAGGSVPTEYLAAMEQTLASQLGIVPFIYYPIFFSMTGFVQGLSPDASWSRAKENFPKLMQRNLLFWIPVQFIQFGFIEEQMQIPFLSAAGLCWTMILSLAAGSAKSYNSPPPVPPTVRLDDSLVQDDRGTGVVTTSPDKAPAAVL